MEHETFYRTIKIDELSIFYREAGPKCAPTLVLLHGLPSSSRMFEPLFRRLSNRYHLVVPDYPGFPHYKGLPDINGDRDCGSICRDFWFERTRSMR